MYKICVTYNGTKQFIIKRINFKEKKNTYLYISLFFFLFF